MRNLLQHVLVGQLLKSLFSNNDILLLVVLSRASLLLCHWRMQAFGETLLLRGRGRSPRARPRTPTSCGAITFFGARLGLACWVLFFFSYSFLFLRKLFVSLLFVCGKSFSDQFLLCQRSHLLRSITSCAARLKFFRLFVRDRPHKIHGSVHIDNCYLLLTLLLQFLCRWVTYHPRICFFFGFFIHTCDLRSLGFLLLHFFALLMMFHCSILFIRLGPCHFRVVFTDGRRSLLYSYIDGARKAQRSGAPKCQADCNHIAFT
mmetsp:Transcript_8776/g.18988  ORF Transcript_8776/g.18988 Transcript_8776/m.18988 type:complete len:261 (-) Transcript_8776:1511-2293(-)